ncbi:MAG TPA: sigma-70 family RNA polymerase sigma factor [Isosphaeraceae bacterium]|jgi:RNA polymerase sigma factor (sigma-70 family)|nr:sigma-70 family RNA polymerase sigma factor [Isosphaeraceae bacterium]
MASDPSAIVGRQLRQLLESGSVAGLTDGQLLERFADRDDPRSESAFEALLARHGPMVLAVCRRVLGDEHAAEDAFQATFLVLARRSGSVRVRDSLGPWLLGVADRTARKARTAAARRVARERRAATPESAPPPPPDDLRPIVLAEVQRLPAKYRAPVLLCYFEGRTHDQAAAELRWPVGTVRGRLSRARDLLRSRFLRRGLAPAAALACLADSTARADLPAALRDLTVGLATRRAPIAAGVALLARQIARSLLMTKLKSLAVVALAVLLLAGASLAAFLAARNPRRPAPTPVAAVRPKPVADTATDPLPKGARIRLGSSLFHTGGPITQVLSTRDGKRLVTVDWTHAVRVWDAASGRLVRTIGAPTMNLHSIALAPDGATLATVDYPARIRLWDLDSGRELRRSRAPGETFSYRLPVVSPDGRTLAAVLGGFDPKTKLHERGLCLWDMATLGEPRRFGGDWVGLDALAFSPDGKTLATGGDDASPRGEDSPSETASTRLWDVATGKETRRFAFKGLDVRAVAFAPDGKALAAAVNDGTIRFYDVARGEEVLPRLGTSLKPGPPTKGGAPPVPGDSQSMMSLAFAPDGKALASGAATPGPRGGFGLASISLWDLDGRVRIREMLAHQQWVSSLSFTPDGRTLASAGTEPTVRVWEVATGRDAFPQSGHRSAIRKMVVSPVDGMVFTAGYDGTVRRWDPDSGRELGVVVDIGTPVSQLAIAPDGKTFIAAGGFGGPIELRDVATGRVARVLKRGDPNRPVGHVAFSPDSRTVASGNDVWDVASGERLNKFQLSENHSFLELFYTSNSKRLIATERDGVRLWEIATGKELRRLIRSERFIGNKALSPDGRLLAKGGFVAGYRGGAVDPPIRLYELATGKEILRLEGLEDNTRDLAFSPDGRLLASAHGDQRSTKGAMVIVWDVASGTELRRFEGHRGAVNVVAFLPDGRSVVSASEDGTALSWDVADLTATKPAAPGDWPALWEDLPSEDAPRAYKASWALADERAIPFLRDHVRPVAEADPKQVAGWIADLDSNQFATRTRAANALATLGEAAAPALRRTLAGKPSAEVRGQIERLLSQLDGPATSSEVVRTLRGIAALERLGSAEARAVLARLAGGVAGARATVEAREALDRLKVRRRR